MIRFISLCCMRACRNKIKTLTCLGVLTICTWILIKNDQHFKYSLEHTRDSFLLVSSTLSSDSNRTILMPYVGNGHLASTIFDNSIFLNGLYNGNQTNSHRARVPNTHNFSFISNDPRGFFNSKYTLDMKKGVFIESLEDNSIIIERRIYAHQYYNRLLITQINVKRKTKSSSGVMIKIDYTKDYSSEDFHFDPIISQDGYKILRGKTRVVEYSDFQKKPRSIVMFFDEPRHLILDPDKDDATWVFLSSIDVDDEASARNEFEQARNLIARGKTHELFDMHSSRFEELWQMGRVETDNIEMQTLINSCFYYILSSLPALNHHGQLGKFFGLSPGTLSRGSLMDDYQGHSFWDTETWMFPSILIFYPALAKSILSYRTSTPEAYAYNAKIFKTSGWRFAWESAYTGLDVTPDRDVGLYEIHNSGDIAFAARQYFSATRDKKWLQSEGGSELILKLAEFWASRITYNQTKSQYEILNVMPPDEDAEPNINNSIYTNVIASMSIHYGNYVTCLTNSKSLDTETMTKARCLHVPFDQTRQIHLEYEGYTNEIIKQADVALLSFPIMWKMDNDIRRNDLLFYGNRTRLNGPAMTWAIHTIGFIDLGEFEKANNFLTETYAPFVRKPFNVWTEQRDGVGAVNFITGMGGFLQAIIFGYGGLRLRTEELTFNGNLPLLPHSTHVSLHRVKYLGAVLSFTNTRDSIVVTVESVDDEEHALEIITPSKIFDLFDGDRIELPKIKFDYVIRAKIGTNCELPLDKIDLKSC